MRIRKLLRGSGLRSVLAIAFVALLGAGAYVVWPRPQALEIQALFPSAVGLYPGDDVKIAGVPVGTISSITPSVRGSR